MGQSPLFPGLTPLWGTNDYGKILCWMFLLLQGQLNKAGNMEKLKMFGEVTETTGLW